MTHRIITLVTALILLAGCSTSPTGRSQLVLIPDSQMNQMGLQAFTNIKQKTPVSSNRKSSNYVECVTNAITRQVGGH